MNMNEKLQLKVIFKGNVQGVFLRQHIKIYADKLNIVGYVKNLKDGSVELVAVADKKKIEAFLEEIEKKPGYGSIDDMEKKYISKVSNFKDFRILF